MSVKGVLWLLEVKKDFRFLEGETKFFKACITDYSSKS